MPLQRAFSSPSLRRLGAHLLERGCKPTHTDISMFAENNAEPMSPTSSRDGSEMCSDMSTVASDSDLIPKPVILDKRPWRLRRVAPHIIAESSSVSQRRDSELKSLGDLLPQLTKEKFPGGAAGTMLSSQRVCPNTPSRGAEPMSSSTFTADFVTATPSGRIWADVQVRRHSAASCFHDGRPDARIGRMRDIVCRPVTPPISRRSVLEVC